MKTTTVYDHTELFCFIDDFFIRFRPFYLQSLKQSGIIKRCREASLALSEIIYLAIWLHLSHFKIFIVFVNFYHHKDFRCLPSYQRINALVAKNAHAIAAFLKRHCSSRPWTIFIGLTRRHSLFVKISVSVVIVLSELLQAEASLQQDGSMASNYI